MDINAKEPRKTSSDKKSNFQINTGAKKNSPIKPTENVATFIAKYHNIRQTARKFVDGVINDASVSIYVNKSVQPGTSSASNERLGKFQERGRQNQSVQDFERKEYKSPSATSSRNAEKEFPKSPGPETIDDKDSPRLSILSENESPENEGKTVDLLKYPALAPEHKFAGYRGTIYQERKSSVDSEDSTQDDSDKPSKSGAPTSTLSRNESPGNGEKTVDLIKYPALAPEHKFAGYRGTIYQERKSSADSEDSTQDDFDKPSETTQGKEPRSRYGKESLQKKSGRRLSEEKFSKQPDSARSSQDRNRKDTRRRSSDTSRGKDSGPPWKDKGDNRTSGPSTQEVAYKRDVSVIDNAEKKNPVIEFITEDDIPAAPSEGILSNPLDENSNDDSNSKAPIKSIKMGKQSPEFKAERKNMTKSQSRRNPTVSRSPEDNEILAQYRPIAQSKELFRNTSKALSADEECPGSRRSSGTRNDGTRYECNTSSASIPRHDNRNISRERQFSSSTSQQLGSQNSRKTLTQEELETLQDNIQRINELVATADVNTLTSNPTLVIELTNLLSVSSAVLKSSDSQHVGRSVSSQRESYPQNDLCLTSRNEKCYSENTRSYSEENTQAPDGRRSRSHSPYKRPYQPSKDSQYGVSTSEITLGNIQKHGNARYSSCSQELRDSFQGHCPQNLNRSTRVGSYIQESIGRYSQGYQEDALKHTQIQDNCLSGCQPQQNYPQNASYVAESDMSFYSQGRISRYSQQKAQSQGNIRYSSPSQQMIYSPTPTCASFKIAGSCTQDNTKQYHRRSPRTSVPMNSLCTTMQQFGSNNERGPQDNTGSFFLGYSRTAVEGNTYQITRLNFRQNEGCNYGEDIQGSSQRYFPDKDEHGLDEKYGRSFSSRNAGSNFLEGDHLHYSQNHTQQSPCYTVSDTFRNPEYYSNSGADFAPNTIPNSSGYTQDRYLEKLPPASSTYMGPYSSEDDTGSFISETREQRSIEKTRLYPASNSEYVSSFSTGNILGDDKLYSSEAEGKYIKNLYVSEHAKAHLPQENEQNPHLYPDVGNPQMSEMPLQSEGQGLGYGSQEGYEHKMSAPPIDYNHKDRYEHTAEFNHSEKYGNHDNYTNQGYWGQNQYDQHERYSGRDISNIHPDLERQGRYQNQHSNLTQYEGEVRFGSQEGSGTRSIYDLHQEGKEQTDINNSTEVTGQLNQFGCPESPLCYSGKNPKGKKSKTMNRTVGSAKYRLENCVHCEVLNLIPKTRIHLHSLERFNRSPVFRIGRSKFCVVNSKINKMLDRIFPFSTATAIKKYNKKVNARNSITKKLTLKQVSRDFLNNDRHFRNSI